MEVYAEQKKISNDVPFFACHVPHRVVGVKVDSQILRVQWSNWHSETGISEGGRGGGGPWQQTFVTTLKLRQQTTSSH